MKITFSFEETKEMLGQYLEKVAPISGYTVTDIQMASYDKTMTVEFGRVEIDHKGVEGS